ncbi:phage major tail tube protein [Desulfobaculum bizertense]|uniref:phage major tail tube protein n=1 Tax=Desulfobaculum bizertense TaxID=376490 RepID=UPI001F46CF24|nr:phage major tail tube protein [Desulfobaculum bizertense]UIJ38734.1 phage major tail tube protein [Desulfobaculum bizertense]
MAASKLLKNFALFVDGRGYAGECEELQPPALSLTTEDFRAGGMDTSIPIDMGMEKLEASFVMPMQDADLLAAFGVIENNGIQMTARGELKSLDGSSEAVTLQMRGTVIKIESSAWKSGELAKNTYTLGLNYYKREQGGKVLHEVDVLNMKRIVNGVDQLEKARTAMGI